MIKVDSFDQQQRLGALHERPRWARAFKWAPMTAETKLQKIAIRVGRTGALNPWAILEPVNVGGVTVSRATLHNEEDINRKEIREGDRVIVQRAGDVIPQIVGPAGPHAKGTKEFRMPERCPLCDAEIVKPEGEVMHRCPNRACPSRGLETLINWVIGARWTSRGSGSSSSGGSGTRGCCARCPTSTGSRAEQLMELDGYGEISAGNAVEAIEQSKQQPFSRVLFGLNIPDVGWVTARNLARHFGDVDRLLDASQEDIQEVDGIGPDRAEAIAGWFEDEQNRTLVAELRELGLRFEVGEEEKAGRGAADGQPVRDHRHARRLHPRRGGGRARLARRQGLRQRLQEDDGRRRRREPGLEGGEGGEGRRAAPHRGRPARARQGRARERRRR